MHALGRPNPYKRGPTSITIPDGTLILTVVMPENANDKGIITLRDILLENIPHFRPFAAALASVGVSHKPVAVRYVLSSSTSHLSHAECKLQSVSHLLLLQSLLNVPALTSLQLELPLFGAEILPALTAHSLTALSLRGELPCTYQFIAALYAPALGILRIDFHRNQWDKLDTPDDPLRDHAYTLPLFPHSFPALRTLRLEEREPRPRWSDVSLGSLLFPLMYIPTLEDVEIYLDASPLWVRDEDISYIAAAWRYISRLVLTCKRAADRVPSLKALLYLEAGCRDLVELVLPKLRLDDDLNNLDFNHAKDTMAFRGQAFVPSGLVGMVQGDHPLRMLRVACQTSGTASKDQCHALGHRLDLLFPNLVPDTQFMSAASADLYMNDWYMVWMGIQSAKAARAPHAWSSV